MKKHLLLVMAVTFGFYQLSAATNAKYLICNSVSTIDTNKYLRDSIIAHKDQFQHKDLNTLLAALHLNVKSYALAKESLRGDAPYHYLTLNFEDPIVINHKEKGFSFLNITFKNDIPLKAIVMGMKYDFKWTQAEIDYFGKMIVKDISGLKENP